MKKLFFTLTIAISLLLVMAFAVCAEEITVVDGTDNITLGDCVIEGLDRDIPDPSSGFTFVLNTETKTAKITKWANYADSTLGAKLVVPSTVTYDGNTYTVTSFDRVANYTDNGNGELNRGNFILTHVYIPDTLVAIPNSAFQSCAALEYVYIGSGLETWGESAFYFAGATAGSYYVDDGAGNKVPLEKTGVTMGNIKEFVLKSKKITTMSKQVLWHTEFDVNAYIELDITQFTTFESYCIGLNQYALTDDHFFEGTGIRFDVFDLRNATSIADDAFYYAYGGNVMIVNADQTKYFNLNKIRSDGSAYYNPETENDATFIIVGGETPETAKTLTGPIWTANPFFWYGSTVFMNVVIRGYVNAYDGEDGIQNQNGYGIDQVDYFFESEDAFNHYINSIESTSSKDTTYARYAKHDKGYFGYFNVCQGNGTLKAYDINYTAATETDAAIVEVVENTNEKYIRSAMTGAYVLDDDCTPSTICICCDYLFEKGIEHEMGAPDLLYSNGYAKAGVSRICCVNDGCTLYEDTEIPALFETKGYSKDTKSSAIVLDMSVNNDAIAEYLEYLVSVNGEATIEYGVVVALADNDGDNTNDILVNGDGTVKASALQIKFPDNKYSSVQTKITGIGESNHETALHSCGYIIVDGVVTYIGGSGAAQTAERVTYASIPDETV